LGVSYKGSSNDNTWEESGEVDFLGNYDPGEEDIRQGDFTAFKKCET